jgi:putative ABC transport system permease protein
MRLGTLIASDLSRSKGRLAVVSAAVAAGVAVVVVLGGVGFGIYEGVVRPLLPKLPLDLLKVEPRTLSVGLLAFDASSLSGGLDARAIERLQKLDGVAAVFPIVGASFPMRAEGGAEFIGHRIRTDLFGTGVAPELVARDVAKGKKFEDPGPNAARVPVIVARRLLELYNTTVASAIHKPRLSEEAVIGFQFELELGSSYVQGTPDPSRTERTVAEIVGFSDQATLIGITVPDETMRRWNQKLGRGETPITGAFVKTKRAQDAGPVAAAIEEGGLKVDDTLKIVGAGIAIASLIFSLFAFALLLLAAFAIAQTFFLLVGERRAELAILRAMGAKRSDLRRLVLVEAGVVGMFGGGVGVLIGISAAAAVDWVVMSLLPDVPFRPTHIVAMPVAFVVLAWVLGVLAALAGAALPALRAAAQNPASALRA